MISATSAGLYKPPKLDLKVVLVVKSEDLYYLKLATEQDQGATNQNLEEQQFKMLFSTFPLHFMTFKQRQIRVS